MYGAILEKGEEYYTYLYKIFTGINMVQKDYNWLLTDIVAYPETKEYQDLFSKQYCWLSGEELTNTIEMEDFQWIWGVLSGFDKSIDIKEILNHSLPYAGGVKSKRNLNNEDFHVLSLGSINMFCFTMILRLQGMKLWQGYICKFQRVILKIIIICYSQLFKNMVEFLMIYDSIIVVIKN